MNSPERSPAVVLVADIASATGMGTELMRSLGAKTCIGVEHDGQAIRHAASAYSGCRFVCCDAMQLSVANDAVDLVVSLETIEHLVDPARFVSECRRVLRPGGCMICSTPNRAVYRWGPSNPFHISEMNVEEFVGLFQTQFAEVRLYGQCEVIYPAQVLRGILRSVSERLHLRKPTAGPARVYADGMVSPGSSHPESAVKPYVGRALVKPTYLVVVAEKPLP